MKIKFILPALIEAKSKYWRPIKYSLFPPLGLATLAAFLNEEDEAEIVDEHVEILRFDDEPDIVAIEVYITSAKRAYEISDYYRKKGVYVVLGGLHVTALPEEAINHANTIITGPAEEAWPRFLNDFRDGNEKQIYQSKNRSLIGLPEIRRDLIKRKNYFVPNSITISRGCPHSCDFCYKESFFKGGISYYSYQIDRAMEEIEFLQGNHLFFLDDNIFGNEKYALKLFERMKGLGKVWQGAATIQSLKNEKLLEVAVESGLRSLFIGFESLNQEALQNQNKKHNNIEEYEIIIKKLHDYGVMINSSFVFGLDEDDSTVFDSTVDWAIKNSIETATFHILTPYPGTRLYEKYQKEKRILHKNWDLYDTRHVVFKHPKMNTKEIEDGYKQAYKKFYKYSSIFRSAMYKDNFNSIIRHLLYSLDWKKIEWFWCIIIKLKKLNFMIPGLEKLLRTKNRINSKQNNRAKKILINEKT